MNENENFKEFEFENRIKWIESKIIVLNLIIKDLQSKTVTETENIKEDILINGDSLINEDSTSTTEIVNNQNTPVPNPKIISTNDILILPPKPEIIPKSLPKPAEQESLVFSEEIQSEHDNLTTELIATVQLIKRNNLHIQKIVKSDDKIITEATGLLATNSDTMQREGKNLKSYSKTAWVSFWKMFLILLFVCVLFIFVYIFIRLT